jgi:uncharacterized protein YjiS (DUF1127 family)
MLKYIWRITNYLTTRAEHRRTIKILNQMTDAELMDIGISRCDISRMIWLDEDKTMKGRGKQ